MRSVRSRFRISRRGLAPLEFVLVLPILMFTAALIVNLGTMQAWRVRGEIVSRDAVWRARWPRRGSVEPRPAARVWPDDARMEVAGGGAIPQIDDPAIDHEVVRGPLDPIEVFEILSPDQGLVRGSAEIDRAFPMLPKLGQYESGDIQHPLLTKTFQAAEMSLPSNTFRRSKAIYHLPEQDPALAQAFVAALEALFNMSNRAALSVLDRDEEVRRYMGGYIDFHPRINIRCELDPEVVKEQEVDRLIDSLADNGEVRLGEISRLPRRLTSFWISMYRSAIQRLEQQIEALKQDPGGDPGQIAAAEAEIAMLEEKLEQLEDFQRRIPEFEEQLEEMAKERLLGGT